MNYLSYIIKVTKNIVVFDIIYEHSKLNLFTLKCDNGLKQVSYVHMCYFVIGSIMFNVF